MVARLILVLGDQLSHDIAALRAARRDTDIVVMAEVRDEASYVPHHPKKIAFLFAAMRSFASEIEAAGWRVAYTRYDDPDNAGSIPGELMRRAAEIGASEVIATEPGEWRLISLLNDVPLSVHQLEDDRFLATHAEFAAWANGRKDLRMEWFYRAMRRKTGLLMDGDKPVGGKWNFDHDNRKPAPEAITYSGPLRFPPNENTMAVLDLVDRHFPDNFGELRPFYFATDRTGARAHLTHWIDGGLPKFGDFQDAMLGQHRFLYHAVVGLYVNSGMLSPMEVCRAAEAAWQAGKAPLNAVEGFIRQVIGWREYVRGIYFREGPDYPRRNKLNQQRKLPGFYWGAGTRMNCVAKSVQQTRDEAYAHHIQRLMVTGNFALLAGVDPTELHEWYLAVYADAFEWVEAPNTVGMSQYADGGIVASKPYVSSGNYIDRMSDYCKTCHYNVKTKTGEGACPFNVLYWHFLDRQRHRLERNPRMAQMYRTWDRMDEAKRKTILEDAGAVLRRLDDGAPV